MRLRPGCELGWLPGQHVVGNGFHDYARTSRIGRLKDEDKIAAIGGGIPWEAAATDPALGGFLGDLKESVSLWRVGIGKG